MGKSFQEINVILHGPSTLEGRKALAHRVAEVHAETLRWYLSHNVSLEEQRKQIMDEIVQKVTEQR